MTTAGQPQVNLAHRLDALRAALHNMEADPRTEPAARELAALIRASSEFRHMDAIAAIAHETEAADTANFQARLRALIALMQQEVGRQAKLAAVLLVATDRELIKELRSGLEARGYPVLVAGTPPEARELLASRTIGVCIVDLVLAKADGRHLIADLRSRPESAALPIVTLVPRVEPGGAETSFSEEDSCFQKPVKTADVIRFLDVRLKRGATKSREARRDPSTGIPNRAA